MAETTVLSGSMSVPMKVPDGFETHEQYRDYLGFRGLIQILVTQIKDAQKSKSLKGVKDVASRMAKDAQKFPDQPFPRDLKVWDFDQDGMLVLADPKVILMRVNWLVGNKIDVDQVKGIEDIHAFSEEVSRLVNESKG